MGHSLVYMPECHSTNDEASSTIQNGDPTEGTVVITNNQTKGRGQRGNAWVSEAGMNLTCSLILKPVFLSVTEQFNLNIAISLGLSDYLNSTLKSDIKIKWPNDIMLNTKKVCGILIENQISGQRIHYSIIGIGLNVNQKDFSIGFATSMALQTGKDFVLKEVLVNLLSCLEKRYLQLRSGNFDELNMNYRNTMYWIGEKHLFLSTTQPGNEARGHEFEGSILGMDELGRLKVETKDGVKIFGGKRN